MSKLEERIEAHLAAIPLEIDRVHSSLAAGLQNFANGTRLQGARYVGAGASGAPLVWASAGRLVGWSLSSAGAPCVVLLTDSRNGTGLTVAKITIPADASKELWLGPGGVSFVDGLYVTVTGAGVLDGALWLGAVD